MTIIFTAFMTNAGVPVVAPSPVPTINVRRLDTNALVVTGGTTVVVGDGTVKFEFTEDPTLEYTARFDLDPTGIGQTTVPERYRVDNISAIEHRAKLMVLYNNGREVAIHFDPTAGNVNTVVGVDGTFDNPVSSEAAIIALAAATGLTTYHFRGIFLALTVAGSYTKSRFVGGDIDASLRVGVGVDISNIDFEDTIVSGDFGGFPCRLNRCVITTTSGDLATHALESEFAGGQSYILSAFSILRRCRSAESNFALGPVEFDLSSISTFYVVIADWSGNIRFSNMTTVGLVTLNLQGGIITIDSTCAAGEISISGRGHIVDNSGPGCTVTRSGFVDSTEIEETHERLGLDKADPVLHTSTSISSTNITQTLDTVGGDVTVTRT